MAFLAAPGPLELMVILGLALLVLGPKRLPEAARSIGRGMRELKEALSSDDDDEPREALPDYPDDEPEAVADDEPESVGAVDPEAATEQEPAARQP
jgi:sec-independent protein translocase protein TatA